MVKLISLQIFCLALVGCATKERKLYIHPPEGMALRTPNLPVTYEVADMATGRTQKLVLPIQHSPQLLKVVDHRNLGSTSKATIADADFLPQEKIGLKTGIEGQKAKSEAETKTRNPKLENLSYLRGVDLISELYKKQRYTDALVELGPLIEQYPSQSRLFVMRGTIYRKIQEPKSALKAYQKAAELDQSNVDLQTIIAQLQLEIGDDSINE